MLTLRFRLLVICPLAVAQLILTETTVADYIIRLALNFLMGYYCPPPHIIHYSAICTKIECCHFSMDFVCKYYYLSMCMCTIKAFSLSTSAFFQECRCHSWIYLELNFQCFSDKFESSIAAFQKAQNTLFSKRFLIVSAVFSSSFFLTSNSVIKVTRSSVL